MEIIQDKIKFNNWYLFPIILFMAYMYIYMSYFMFQSNFDRLDFKIYYEVIHTSENGINPYEQAYANRGIGDAAYYYSPLFLNYMKLFKNINPNPAAKYFVLVNFITLMISLFLCFYFSIKYFNISFMYSLLFLLIIIHFNPGIIWNFVIGNWNEPILFIMLLSVFLFLKKQYFLIALIYTIIFFSKLQFFSFPVFIILLSLKYDKKIFIKLILYILFMIIFFYLIDPHPNEWWFSWINRLLHHHSLDTDIMLDFRDVGLSQFGLFGSFIRFVTLFCFFIFTYFYKVNTEKDLIIYSVIAISVSLIIVNLALIHYIIFFLPLQFIFIINLYRKKYTIYKFIIALFLTLSLVTLSGPFVEKNNLRLTSLDPSLIKDMIYFVFFRFRAIGFLSISLLIIFYSVYYILCSFKTLNVNIN